MPVVCGGSVDSEPPEVSPAAVTNLHVSHRVAATNDVNPPPPAGSPPRTREPHGECNDGILTHPHLVLEIQPGIGREAARSSGGGCGGIRVSSGFTL